MSIEEQLRSAQAIIIAQQCKISVLDKKIEYIEDRVRMIHRCHKCGEIGIEERDLFKCEKCDKIYHNLCNDISQTCKLCDVKDCAHATKCKSYYDSKHNCIASWARQPCKSHEGIGCYDCMKCNKCWRLTYDLCDECHTNGTNDSMDNLPARKYSIWDWF
jgi:hypothetical protein